MEIQMLRKKRDLKELQKNDLNLDSSDPYHDSDNDNDPDFMPPPPKKSRSTANATKIVKKHKKVLTPHERIERLKKIASKRNIENKQPPARVPNASPISETSKIGTNGPEQNNVVEIDDINITTSFDHYFSDEIEIFDALRSSNFSSQNQTVQSKPLSPERSPEPLPEPLPDPLKSLPQIQPISNSLYDLLLDLRGQILDLNKSVTLLRKQVARLELKTTGWPIGSDGKACMIPKSSEVDASLDSSDLLDFESLLAQEGLPMGTCVEVNAFEAKLRRDSQYRIKLVSKFAIILYFPIEYSRMLKHFILKNRFPGFASSMARKARKKVAK